MWWIQSGLRHWPSEAGFDVVSEGPQLSSSSPPTRNERPRRTTTPRNAVLPMMRTATATATSEATASEEEDEAHVRVSRDVAVSAPGKVLLCGGYLIVQQPQPPLLPPPSPAPPTEDPPSEPPRGHAGIVLAVDKRFYCRGHLRVVTTSRRSGSVLVVGIGRDHVDDALAAADANDDDDDDDTDPNAEADGPRPRREERPPPASTCGLLIRVESPQYGEAYDYEWHPSRPRHLAAVVPNDDDASSHHHPHQNSFVEHTVRICCDNYAPILADLLRVPSSSSRSPMIATTGEIHLVVLGDDEFWSHPRRPPRGDQDEGDDENEAEGLPTPAHPSWTHSAVVLASEPSSSSSTCRQRQRQRPRCFRKAPRGADGSVLKTGLGSSACLVTSLVAAMDHLLHDPDDDDREDEVRYDQRRRRRRLRRIANLSQLCHCVAQGKIGSGFDVSAACWGSHAYHRFDASGLHLDALIGGDDKDDDEAETTSGNDPAILSELSIVQRAVLDESWTERCVVAPIVPPNSHHRAFAVQVVLADTAGGGSSSPGMSRLVLEHAGSDAWNALAGVNRTLVELWRRVIRLDLSDAERQCLASCTATEWIELGHGRTSRAHDGEEEETEESETGEAVRRAAQVLGELSRAFREWRVAFKALGVVAGADLEPDAQSALADSTELLRGVVSAVVPGAGGHDALACLYVNDEPTRTRIVEHWRSSSGCGAVPALDVRIVPFGDGVRVEEDLDSLLWSCEEEA